MQEQHQHAPLRKDQDEALTTSSELSRRHAHHSYEGVTLNHSQAHLGDVYQHNVNNYYGHKDARDTASRTGDTDEDTLLGICLGVFFVHTCSQLPSVFPSIGLFTWNADVETTRWVRIGAGACIVKYVGLLGLAVWDGWVSEGRLLLRYRVKYFVACWMLLTELDLPRTFKLIHALENLPGMLHGLRALCHICGAIAEHLLGYWTLWHNWKDGDPVLKEALQRLSIMSWDE